MTPGKEYSVLEVYAQSDGQNYVRIESIPQQLPGLFDTRLFEVSQTEIPSTWNTFIDAHGGISICPSPWLVPGFWESLMDGEGWAVDCYEREKSKIELQ
ncbi:hypothetical protein [Streptomyces sp. NRRL S-1813]|uniref:hypothetical protein n=1 Tax=Streptomyces sp. NRRL S-1813 TaxID=1463888 RepID=UPI00131A647C|nr:hypothetical protein [Streptomyces sp. NRRL S-1813]